MQIKLGRSEFKEVEDTKSALACAYGEYEKLERWGLFDHLSSTPKVKHI